MTGSLMAAEMAEQPERLLELLGRFDAIVKQVRGAVPTPFHGITIVARGSSDHAAIFGRYLLEASVGKPVSLAAPSLHTLYGIETDYRGQLVIAVSQSGATPEIVSTLSALQDAGGRGLAITNEPSSALADAAHRTIALDVGRERAVPATKTVTGQLTAVAIIACALGRPPFGRAELERLPDAVQAVLDDPEPTATAAAETGRLLAADRGRARVPVRGGARDGAEDQGDLLGPGGRLLGGRSAPRPDRGGDERPPRDRIVQRRAGCS